MPLKVAAMNLNKFWTGCVQWSITVNMLSMALLALPSMLEPVRTTHVTICLCQETWA
jgi:TPP-dependent trihydroxycyclohexane-1,2-dione (THcHDO) dehydratase